MDELYNNRVRLVCTAEAPPDELFAGAALPALVAAPVPDPFCPGNGVRIRQRRHTWRERKRPP